MGMVVHEAQVVHHRETWVRTHLERKDGSQQVQNIAWKAVTSKEILASSILSVKLIALN